MTHLLPNSVFNSTSQQHTRSVRSQAIPRAAAVSSCGKQRKCLPTSSLSSLLCDKTVSDTELWQMEGSTIIKSVVGPMGHSPSDLCLLFKALLSAEPWKCDPEVIELPWREQKYNSVAQSSGQGLVFGVMFDDGVVMPHPPVKRALQETVTALRRQGHQIVDWKPNHAAASFDITVSPTPKTLESPDSVMKFLANLS